VPSQTSTHSSRAWYFHVQHSTIALSAPRVCLSLWFASLVVACRVASFLFAVTVLFSPAASAQKFRSDDPIWEDHDRENIPGVGSSPSQTITTFCRTPFVSRRQDTPARG
jgi:hypothetical protein